MTFGYSIVIKEDLKAGLLFRRLNDAQLDRVVRNASRLTVSSGQMLFSQGQAADRFFFLVRGQIKLYCLSPSGKEKIVEIITPGNTFGEALMFLDRPYFPVCATALCVTELITLSATDFKLMLADSVETCFMLLGDMSQRLKCLISEIDQLSLHSASSRVASYLHGRMSAEGDSFDLEVGKAVLASRLSIKPETFSRILKSLIEQGIIEIQRNRVRVLDRQALSDFIEMSQDCCPYHD